MDERLNPVLQVESAHRTGRRSARSARVEVITIDQVARAVGYNSRSSFSRAFRQAHGVEPKAHRGTGGASQDCRP
jgi:AraC-like DNA-binding protein